MMRVAVLGLMLLSCLAPATAWDNDDLEIFDLVELINKNFYEQLGVKQVSFVTWTRRIVISTLVHYNLKRFRMQHLRRSSEPSVVFRYSSILTKTRRKMPTSSLEI